VPGAAVDGAGCRGGLLVLTTRAVSPFWSCLSGVWLCAGGVCGGGVALLTLEIDIGRPRVVALPRVSQRPMNAPSIQSVKCDAIADKKTCGSAAARGCAGRG
jgi:hypothetical protein